MAEVVALIGVASEDLPFVICALPLDEVVSVVGCSSDVLYFFDFVVTLVLLAGVIAPSGLVYQQAFIVGKAPSTVTFVFEVVVLCHVCLIARPGAQLHCLCLDSMCDETRCWRVSAAWGHFRYGSRLHVDRVVAVVGAALVYH